MTAPDPLLAKADEAAHQLAMMVTRMAKGEPGEIVVIIRVSIADDHQAFTSWDWFWRPPEQARKDNGH